MPQFIIFLLEKIQILQNKFLQKKIFLTILLK